MGGRGWAAGQIWMVQARLADNKQSRAGCVCATMTTDVGGGVIMSGQRLMAEEEVIDGEP